MINMAWISNKQKKTIKIIKSIVKEFGEDKWFIQKELPNVTAHTMKALILKGYIEEKTIDANELKYYRALPKVLK